MMYQFSLLRYPQSLLLLVFEAECYGDAKLHIRFSTLRRVKVTVDIV